MGQDEGHLLFLDFETTGLDHSSCHVLETSFLIAGSGNGIPQITKPATWLSSPSEQELWDTLEDGAAAMHKRSGLLADIEQARSIGKLTDIDEVEQAALDCIAERCPGRVTVAGCGVSALDMPIIARLMPRLATRCHYGPIDITMVRRMARVAGRVLPSAYPFTDAPHRAEGDVLQSLRQAQHLSRLLRTGHPRS